jgi:hypothetical protein
MNKPLALEMEHLNIRAPLGELEMGLLTMDFERNVRFIRRRGRGSE